MCIRDRFYNVRHRVEFWQPAVIRQRKLASLTFGYQYGGQPDFGLQAFSRQAAQGRDGAVDPVHEVSAKMCIRDSCPTVRI